MVEEVQRRTGKGPEECRRILNSPALDEYWTLTGDVPSDECERHDPIELDPARARALLWATLEAEQEVGKSGDLGHCYVFWECKKRILRNRYGVTWRDPADLNLQIDYD
jgi:hypothetical protein